MKIGIVLDSWKLSIFERHLKEAGYVWIRAGRGPVKDSLSLVIRTDDPAKLSKTIDAAQAECNATKAEAAAAKKH